MYRISWRYIETGMIGHGSYIFQSYEHAMNIASLCNRRYPNLLHYVESEVGAASPPE